MSGQGWMVLILVALALLGLTRKFLGKRGGCCGDGCGCKGPKRSG